MTAASVNFCRPEKVLVLGKGTCFISLISALSDSGVEAEVFMPGGDGTDAWREAVPSYDFIIYINQNGDVEELRALHSLCRKARKVLLPAVILGRFGLVGPLVYPDSEACWESAWRRLHRCSLGNREAADPLSPAAEAMLANVIVSEVRRIAEGARSELSVRFFMLDLHTLEGDYHSFLPHPLATGRVSPERTFRPLDLQAQQSVPGDEDNLLAFFDRLTSEAAGIFHCLGEGELRQLPLAQCGVRAADPLSGGPAELLPEVVRAGLTHMEARREAGLAGLESYAARLAGLPLSTAKEYFAAGAGSTLAEGVCRALQSYLTDEWGRSVQSRKPSVSYVNLTGMEDKHCAYYLQALTALWEAPAICLGEPISGFPAVWVSTGGQWYGSASLNTTMALRNALTEALMDMQNQRTGANESACTVPDVQAEPHQPRNLSIPGSENIPIDELLQSALQVLERHGKQLLMFELEIEPGIKQELEGLTGVLIREKESL